YALLAQDVRADVAFEPFTARTNEGERAYGRGAIVIPVQRQALDATRLHALVDSAARAAGVAVQTVASGAAVQGPDVGSRSFRPLSAPRVLMPVGEGLSSTEAGQLWHLLDTGFDVPVTKVDVSDWGRADLSRYDAIVL